MNLKQVNIARPENADHILHLTNVTEDMFSFFNGENK